MYMACELCGTTYRGNAQLYTHYNTNKHIQKHNIFFPNNKLQIITKYTYLPYNIFNNSYTMSEAIT